MIKFKNYLLSSFFNDFGRWPLWIPVFFGMGIAVYFSLSFEPPLWWAYGGMGFFVFAVGVARLHVFSLIILTSSFFALGFSIALLRTHFFKDGYASL